jgi:Flp pilus assembly pilin Flp
MNADGCAGASAPESERGATAVEYALLMTLIAIAIIGGVALFGGAVQGLFDFDFPGG